MAAILILSVLLSRSYFQLNVLKPCIYRFSGSASLLALSIFMSDRKRGYGGHLDFITFKIFLFSAKCISTWYIIIKVFGVCQSIGIVICPFSSATENDTKPAILISSILIMLTCFQLNALNLVYKVFSGSASLCATEKEAVVVMFS